MTLTEAIFCGILQGIAEFLPISSSGHLALAHAFFGEPGGGESLTFDVLLHLATLFVVFTFYYKEIFSLIPAAFTMLGKVFRGRFRLLDYTKNERFVILVLIATVPLALGIFVEEKVAWFASFPKLVGAVLLLNGALLVFSDHLQRKKTREELTPLGAFFVGLFQLAALMPGLSRSGSTISGGLFMGLDRRDAVKFSFILSIPAIVGANLLHVPDVFSSRIASGELAVYLVGMLCAAAAGFFAMKLLLYISEKSKFGVFAYYSFAVGALALFFG